MRTKGWLERYSYFKKGQVLSNVSLKLQQFFKTNPTEEQLCLLDQIHDEQQRKDTVILALVLVVYMLLGGVIGYILGLYHCLFSFVW